GDYVASNLSILAPGGRHVSLSFMQGAKIELDLQLVMRKGLSLTSSTLRPKSPVEKMRLAQRISRHLLPLIAAGKITPILHQTLPLAQAADAHRILEANTNIGKVLLQVAP
ncbi:TPA: zinc-binding dehydrogenase, partial [Klebsiella pneumoniae]|nr:zinc-binding dehydrogenase [Klebsiella pneumoniae]